MQHNLILVNKHAWQTLWVLFLCPKLNGTKL
nr:MAG TPA: hypothetical protein [Caudoviricetes sp.]